MTGDTGRDDPLPAGTATTETEAIHRLLVASVRDYAIFALDATGHVMTWNAGAERLKGYLPEEIIGKHFSIFYPEETRATDFPTYELEVASREGVFEDEGWRIRKDGKTFWANVVITALRDETGTLVGFAKVTRDLTERRKAQQQAIEDALRVAEAESANRAKSQFLAAMSHELRTPLNAIGGYIDLLSLGVHGPLSDAQSQAIERVRNAQQHLVTLISDLLNFSRMEAGRLTYEIADVDIAEVMESVRIMIEAQATARQVEVHWEPAEGPVVGAADQARIGQILLNLLGNAIKFTEPGGTIRIRCARDGKVVRLEVEDTGIGIPADQLDAIFEPFTQVGRTLTSPQQGTGLGLAISRDLARAMDGDITVDSEPGRGSTFTLTLPAARS
ncbi:MAG: ATP-binding protein [Gemmatimonadota bacterium]